MNRFKLKLSILICIFSIILILPNPIYAQNAEGENAFITLVNPVRVSAYTKDSVSSIASQYSEINKRNLPATWLFTYDVLENIKVTDFVKQMDQKQDLGIFLEVTPNFAKSAGVIYNKTDSWHRSNSIFLSGYSQEDRKKLINVVFEKFKANFGYYPKSVGAWWIDSFSLSWMKEKYNITSNLGCADQFYTDGYSLWGQYWSTPFYPSKNHAGMPARNMETKLDIVALQWAARDPFNGYSSEGSSAYSTQDYHTLNLSDSYFEALIKLYALKHNNQFGQITLGLEGDFPAETYHGLYSKQLDIIQKISIQENITITNMKDFSNWYRRTFTAATPSQVIESNDLLGRKITSIWYQSPAYRIGLIYDSESQEMKFIDWRTYQDNFQEPFYLTPNTQLNLYINTPSLIDQISDSQSIWKIPTKGAFSSGGDSSKFSIYFDSVPFLTFEKDKLTFKADNLNLPSAIKKSDLLKVKNLPNTTEINIVEHWLTPPEGMTFRSLPPQFFYFSNSYNLSKPKVQKGLLIILFTAIFSSVVIYKRKFYKKRTFWIIGIVFLAGSILIFVFNSRIYSVSQAEMDALLHLKALEPGKVIVYDQTCLKCIWHTQDMPAAFANIRTYVSQISQKPIVYNRSIFVAETRPLGKNQLDKLKAKYIYLVKYENYTETLPFSPGDYSVELIYENANAQIWLIKNHAKE